MRMLEASAHAHTYTPSSLTCCSVQDLGLKKYAGVLISDASQQQSLSLDRTPGDYNLWKEKHTRSKSLYLSNNQSSSTCLSG